MLSAACETRTAAERGAELFSDPSLSPAATNTVACSDCHSPGDVPPDRILAGGSLRNVVGRPSYWAGEERELRDAVNACLRFFMRHPDAAGLGPDDPRGLDLFAYLETLGAEPADAVAFTVPRVVATDGYPVGDGAAGQATYVAACLVCHGAASTGEGRRSAFPPVIPTETIDEHGEFARDIVLNKIRHGGFYGIGGDMPPFSMETLTDAQVGDLLTFFGLPPAAP